MRLFVYDMLVNVNGIYYVNGIWDCLYMLVNVNGIYYVHACEKARWARSAGNSATDFFFVLLNKV